MSLNSHWAALDLTGGLFAVVLLAAAVGRVVMMRSRKPLRLKQRIQIFSLVGILITATFLFWSRLRSNHFGKTDVFSFVCLMLVVGIAVYELYRRRSNVLVEEPRPIVPLKFPRLLWPLVVVLAPLLVLGLLATWTLNSDRRSAREEATARANEIGSAIMASAQENLKIVEFTSAHYSVTKGQNIITVNHHGELIQPRPTVWPPQPAPLTAKDFSNLKSNKLAQWNDAETAFAAGEWKRAADLYLAFLGGLRHLGSQPMADVYEGIADSHFRPIALSRRAAAVEKSGDIPGAIAAYNDIFDGFVLGPEAISESGVALAPLAVLKILDLARDNPEALPEEWRHNPQFLVSEIAQNGPVSPISEEAIRRLRQIAPALISSSDPQLTTNSLFDLWDRSVAGRQFHAEAMEQLGTNDWPDAFWSDGREPWLAVKQTPPPGWPTGAIEKSDETIYAIIRYDWLLQQLSKRWQELDRHHDFVIRVVIEGKMLLLSGGWAPRNIEKLFDAAAGRESAGMQQLHSASLPINLIVSLQDPEMYYRAVHRRQFLFSALIIGALLAGLVSAIVLRRSLIRQQSLNEQKSNFVSSVSHELRAPIASVRLMAESLERGKVAEGAKQNEYYRFIVQECRRLSALIENVLDFSRIEQGRKQYEFEPTDVLALTRETVKLMEPYAEEKGVQLKMETSNIQHPTSNIELEMDGRAMQQALVNLIDNAIKHSAKGQTVTIGWDAESRTGVLPVSEIKKSEPDPREEKINSETGRMPVLLYVEDHGPGIPPAEHEKIFERFYRLGSELRRETQGVGIGLSIVRHIVAAHGGNVTVRSNIGEGSRFTIVLPVRLTETTDGHR